MPYTLCLFDPITDAWLPTPEEAAERFRAAEARATEAEAQARAETAARAEAEARVRELEAELRRLRGEQP
jgi:hypothetical protein